MHIMYQDAAPHYILNSEISENNVILDNDIIMIWTNCKKEIKKISLRYNGATYVLKLNEE